jgi:hypothetical protein
MKSEEDIQGRIKTCERIREDTDDKYSELNQIDMLSAEGRMLLQLMDQMTGQIAGLNWVLDNV